MRYLWLRTVVWQKEFVAVEVNLSDIAITEYGRLQFIICVYQFRHFIAICIAWRFQLLARGSKVAFLLISVSERNKTRTYYNMHVLYGKYNFANCSTVNPQFTVPFGRKEKCKVYLIKR